MHRNRSIPAVSFIPVLVYPDVRAAVAFLEDAVGFTERVQIGEDHRAQLSYGDGAVIIGDVRHRRRPPRPDEETHSVVVRVADARAHCEHARGHGAIIHMEPTEFEYGERQYEAEDLAGHRWTFSETLRDAAPAEWGGEGGWRPESFCGRARQSPKTRPQMSMARLGLVSPTMVTTTDEDTTVRA